MARSKFSAAFPYIFYFTILLLSVEMMVISEAKECGEGLPWVEADCFGEEVTTPCWAECYRRHGTDAKASCRNLVPVFPNQVCWCSWAC